MPYRPKPIRIPKQAPIWEDDLFTTPASSPAPVPLPNPAILAGTVEMPKSSPDPKPIPYFEAAPWYTVNPGNVRLMQDECVRICPKCGRPAVMKRHPGGIGHPGPWTQFAHSVLARCDDLLVAAYHCVVEGRVD